jgi:hypothetical protein
MGYGFKIRLLPVGNGETQAAVDRGMRELDIWRQSRLPAVVHDDAIAAANRVLGELDLGPNLK